jgi:DNA-binding NtrC family response regulator
MHTLNPLNTILLIDDELEFLDSAAFALKRVGLTNVEVISDSRNVLPRIARGGCGVVACDIKMPYVSGYELLEKISKDYPDIRVIMVTGANDVLQAVNCMKLGATDYILKPLQQVQFIAAIKKAIELQPAQNETSSFNEQTIENKVKHPEYFKEIITNSPLMNDLFSYVEVIAATDLPILITGETGTGKELMASAIHRVSGRTGDFVCVNAAGIDDNVLSDTLFGHQKGAFTGADRDRKGLIETANQGTLFLDEIGDLRMESQVKLLRLLQEGTYHPIGSDFPKYSSARVIVATNCELKEKMRTGLFRPDLFYRLQAHEVKISPLRERICDIRLLANAFVADACEKTKKKQPFLSQEFYSLLATYSWPGNIRELKGIIFDVISRNSTDTISLVYLKEKLRELRSQTSMDNCFPKNTSTNKGAFGKSVIFSSTLPTAEEMEYILIREALMRTNGNKSFAADLLGIARNTVIKKLKQEN